MTLDIGHTPARPGAIGASGKSEYRFNLRLAYELARALRGRGIGVSIGNEGGRNISLAERARRLAAVDAGLVLSLHHDSVQPIYLKTRIVGGRPRRYTDHAAGYSIFVSGLSPAFSQSNALARSVGAALRKAGFAPSLHHAEKIPGEGRPILDSTLGLFRYDGLAVLRTARVPALLFEAGVIANPADEAELENPATRARMVAALADGVKAFCGAGG